MSQPVWVLSVDLQTKTATFTTGLADAAKKAKGSFNEIKEGAAEMGKASSLSMMEARHSVMLAGEAIDVKLSRPIAGFLASLGPIGPAMEAAFPFLAIGALAAVFIEHLHKAREEAEKLAESQEHFGTAINNAFNVQDTKIL